MAIPQRYRRKRNTREPKKKYIIATEGEKTEKIYFEKFGEQNYRQNIFVQILPSKKDGDSAPEKVLERLNKFAREKVFDEDRDECWLVIDYDNWGDKKLNQIHEECKQRNYRFAVSNPCFELWLSFHQANPKAPNTCAGCIKEVRKLLGAYDKASYDVDKLLKNLDKAIAKSKQLDKNKERFPMKTGTHVYSLVEKLISEEI